jgi:3',5'-cyclic AMP phosphodiesterase CpdA
LSELAGKRATGFINWQRKRKTIHRGDVLDRIVADLKAQAPDHIAVTGDLVNLSLPGEYKPARAWLESLGRPSDVTLVPGNHDAYVASAVRLPQFYWGDYMRGDDGTRELVFPFVQWRGPLALIGLSSAVPTAPFMATGELGAGQLERLGDLLDRCGQGHFRVVLIHHPPQSQRSDHFKRLIDGEALRATLKRHGAELIIHGHDHRHARDWLEGIPSIGVPSASEAPPGEHDPAGYNLYGIDGGPGAWRCELITRGLTRDVDRVVELRRMTLYSD